MENNLAMPLLRDTEFNYFNKIMQVKCIRLAKKLFLLPY